MLLNEIFGMGTSKPPTKEETLKREGKRIKKALRPVWNLYNHTGDYPSEKVVFPNLTTVQYRMFRRHISWWLKANSITGRGWAGSGTSETWNYPTLSGNGDVNLILSLTQNKSDKKTFSITLHPPNLDGNLEFEKGHGPGRNENIFTGHPPPPLKNIRDKILARDAEQVAKYNQQRGTPRN